jgi:two-component system KDP operon response regulator KdpE
MSASCSRPRARLLALSDEVQLHRLLRSILTTEGRALVAQPFARLSGGAREACDVVLIDLDRLDLGVVAKAKRVFPGAEILALCGESREADRVAALEMGADCLERPFRAADLRARVRAAELRRFYAREERRYYRRGALTVDLFERRVSRDGRPLALTPSEIDVLAFLAREAGRAARFVEILEALGRDDSPRDRQALRAFVSGLRRKIERDAGRPELLLSEPRIGYRLVAERGDGRRGPSF